MGIQNKKKTAAKKTMNKNFEIKNNAKIDSKGGNRFSEKFYFDNDVFNTHILFTCITILYIIYKKY